MIEIKKLLEEPEDKLEEDTQKSRTGEEIKYLREKMRKLEDLSRKS